jgi:2-keto-4-pentenoate hydratase/2-oxohepta-3-ene-1,7-dioic acid hydratase in catechol pathway
MQVVRIAGPQGPTFGYLEGDTVHQLDAPPWDRWAPSASSVPLDQVRLLAPATPSKIVGVGRNYRDHIEEMGYVIPDRPAIFLKPPSSLVGPFETVVLPPANVTREVQHEAELALVVGAPMRHVDAEVALDHVYGYTAANDISARDLQREDGAPTRAKAFDTFCPLGPWIETDLDPTAGLTVRCWIGDELRQDGNTDQLVFDLPALLSFLSNIMTLVPGDVVLTGTPGGCTDLRPGDRMRVEIQGVGELENPVDMDAPS